jgi:protocatechuate 3,4-dioxygenase beta subunit
MTGNYRRTLLLAAAALPVSRWAHAQPTCGTLTPPETEGPFFKVRSPERTVLLEGNAKGKTFVLTGFVLARDCKPVANALLDFWHADEAGDYDNRGFRYRGHQHSDAQGRWRLETIVPAEYPGRTRHIHVKVQAPGKRVLTTQLYFPGDPGNARDGLYRPELEIRKDRFDFVVEA